MKLRASFVPPLFGAHHLNPAVFGDVRVVGLPVVVMPKRQMTAVFFAKADEVLRVEFQIGVQVEGRMWWLF